MFGPEDQPASGKEKLPSERADASAGARRPRPRRHWGRWIGLAAIVVVLLLAILVGATPALISSRTGTGYLVSLVNRRIAGTLQVQALSLSWAGPTVLRGVRVLDPEQREVLNVDRVRAAPGVWRLIWDALNFGEITVVAPRAVLYLTANNQASIASAFQSRHPQPSAPGGKLPEPRGRVSLEGGSVRLVRDSGASYDLANVGGQLDVQTLSNLSGQVHVEFADGAVLAADAAMHDLVSQGAFRPAGAAGKLSVTTNGAIELGPLTRVLTPSQAVDGTLTANLEASGNPGAFQGDFAVGVKGLQTAARQAAQAAPIDMQVKGQASREGQKLLAQADFSAGAAGSANARLSYNLAGSASEPRDQSVALDPASEPASSGDQPLSDQVLSALLSGTPLHLPDFALDIDGRLDIAKLARALPGLLRVREGREITGGTLSISQVSLHGGAEPTASGGIALQDVSVASGQGTAQLKPISVAFNMALKRGKGLEIRQAEVKSAFADLQAQGSASDLQATLRSDLRQLRTELSEVFDLGNLDLTGELASKIQLSRKSDDRVSLALDTTVDRLRVGRPDRQFDLAHLAVKAGGTVHQEAARPGGIPTSVGKIEISSADVNLDDQVTLSATGWYDLHRQAFRADADVNRADLGFFARRADQLGVSALGRYGGTLALKTTVERTAANRPITGSGNLTAQNLTLDNKPLVEGDAQLAWDNLQVTPAGPEIQAESVHLQSTPAQFDVQHVRWQGGPALVLNADVKGSADLARLMELIGTAGKMEKPPAVAGKLSLDSHLATANRVVSLTARGGVDELAVGSGEETIRQSRVDFDAAGKLDQQADRLTVKQIKLNSAPLTAQMAGTVDHFSADRELALKGRYDASWKELTAILHELAPATTKTVVVAGKSQSAFEITGPLRPGPGESSLAGLKSSLALGWTSAELYSLGLGPAKLKPTLADGKLTLPRTTILAGDGKVNLAAVVDLTQPDPMLNITGTLQALDRVALTPVLAHEVLSWVSPIFMYVARIDGRLNAQTIDVHLPLSEAIKRSGNAQAVLDLEDVKLEPAGLLGDLAKLIGQTGAQMTDVTFSKMKLRIKDGRIYYDDLTLTFPMGYDLKFRGSVGFDSTVDLVVSLPLTMQLLDQIGGIKTPLGLLTDQLPKMRVDVPLVGTREHPRLDFAKVDKQAIMKQLLSLPAAPAKGVEGLLKELPGMGGGGKKQ